MCGAHIDFVIRDSLDVSVLNHVSITLMGELVIDFIVNFMLNTLCIKFHTFFTDIDAFYLGAK